MWLLVLLALAALAILLARGWRRRRPPDQHVSPTWLDDHHRHK